MVFVKNSLLPVRASQIKVGDMLGEQKVSEVKSVKRRGVYAPVTESGDIIVSGVLASSYAALHNYTPVNQHWEAHAFFAVRRLVCRFNFGICENETYTDEGIPEWLSNVANFAKSTQDNAPAQLVASVVGLPLISIAYVIEQVTIQYQFIAGLLLLGLVVFKQKKTKKSKGKMQWRTMIFVTIFLFLSWKKSVWLLLKSLTL